MSDETLNVPEVTTPIRTSDILQLDADISQEMKDVYIRVASQMIKEFPPLEGYQTAHALAVERLAMFWVRQKIIDSKTAADIDWGQYKVPASAFIRQFEALLKEAKQLGAERTFKFQFVRDVLEVIDRYVKDKNVKKAIAEELRRLSRR